MVKKIFIMVVLSLLITSSVYARSADEARVLLLQTNTKYDLQTFLTKIIEGDNFMASLFIDSGFDLNEVSPLDNTQLKLAVLHEN